MVTFQDIHPLTYFLRNHKAQINRMKQTGNPELLTVNGKAELVIIIAAVFQALLDKVGRAETIEPIRKGLAEAIGTSQRTISYYENEAGYPQAPVIAELARALGVTTDELLGVQAADLSAWAASTSEQESLEARRVWKKFQHLLRLPEKDQRVVIRSVNPTCHGSQS